MILFTLVSVLATNLLLLQVCAATKTDAKECVMTAEPPEGGTGCCGEDNAPDYKIFPEYVTEVGQYPWVAIIEYKKDDKIKQLCGGALISGQYVLTSAHCVNGPESLIGTPTNIRLGEYDTSNDGPDCEDLPGEEKYCSDGATVIPIEKTITHPEYNADKTNSRHDIALIKLKDTATFTNFIRPICLPAADYDWTGDFHNLWVSGWGAYNESIKNSHLQLQADLLHVPLEECKQLYTTISQSDLPWEGHICAGGTKNTCKGNSGGPLMYKVNSHWEIVGTLSFGPTSCGANNIPDVFTKVFQYLPWIREQMTE